MAQRCFVSADHCEADPLPQPLGFPLFPRPLSDAPAKVLDEVAEGGTKDSGRLHRRRHEVIPLAEVGVALAFPGLGGACGSTGCGSAVDEVGAAEGVHAGGVPRKHLALPEGVNGDAVGAASITAVYDPWLEDGRHTGR